MSTHKILLEAAAAWHGRQAMDCMYDKGHGTGPIPTGGGTTEPIKQLCSRAQGQWQLCLPTCQGALQVGLCI